MNQGECHGGPMDGLLGQSRFGKGFVVMDVLSRRACVYDAFGTRFVARAADTYDEEKAEKAAAGDTYDVRAYDPETMGEW
jgi:hypothetical protein